MILENMEIQFFEKYKKYLEKPITNDQLLDFKYYCEKKWFIPIIKQYGIIIVLIILEYYKSEEKYLICKDILESIENSNKHFGTTYPKKLEDYGYMS